MVQHISFITKSCCKLYFFCSCKWVSWSRRKILASGIQMIMIIEHVNVIGTIKC